MDQRIIDRYDRLGDGALSPLLRRSNRLKPRAPARTAPAGRASLDSGENLRRFPAPNAS
jgi:hypothetical protein